MKMNTGNMKETARKRAEIIMKVRSGLMSAKDAARELGVSRKTYYEWEEKALEGMMDGLINKSPGRPSFLIDPEKEELRRENEDLKKMLDLSEKTLQIRDIMNNFTGVQGLVSDKESGKKKE